VLRLPAKPESVGTSIGWIEAQCDEHAIDRDVALRLAIVVEEVTLNLVAHGGTPPPWFELSFLRAPDRLEIVIEDDGVAFDPTAADGPALVDEIDGRPIGGLGIHLVISMMDEAVYRRENGRNRLALSKYL
jgi:anti-sigma regulatory factor (Ser/Thr protein kinase)